MCKSNWAQWDSFVFNDGELERHCELADGLEKTAKIVIPRKKVKEVLAEMHVVKSGGNLGVNKTIDKVRQRYYW